MESRSSTPTNAPSIPSLGHNMANTQIDFTRPPTSQVILLPTPQDGDSLSVLAHKMSALGAFIQSHKSIAVATNFKNMAFEPLDPVTIALAGATYVERDMHNAWKAGVFSLPSIDWQSMTEPAFTGKNSRSRNKARLEAIRIIWAFPHATEENLAYITKHMEHLLPLVRAVAKIEGAKRDLSGNQEVLSIEEWAEMQCVRGIQQAARRVSNQAWEKINRLQASISASVAVIQARKEALEAIFREQGVSQKELHDMLSGLERSLNG